jgi:5-(hydroxymethyl)furfural/furfural oxidase
MLRYTSRLAGTGPNDMQLVWMSPMGSGPDAAALALLLPAVMQVFSTGEVRLRSDDPADDPVVEFRLLSDERDRVRLCDGVRQALELVRQPAMAAIITEVRLGDALVGHEPARADIDEWLANSVIDYVHAAGTCRMGRVGDPAAVVDAACRVIGLEGIRVCDASVIPELPRANTHLTTVAIAERAARLIRSAGSP